MSDERSECQQAGCNGDTHVYPCPDFHFKPYEVEILIGVTIDGDNYSASDWDGNEAKFREEMTKEAREGVRHKELDFVEIEYEERESDVSE